MGSLNLESAFGKLVVIGKNETRIKVTSSQSKANKTFHLQALKTVEGEFKIEFPRLPEGNYTVCHNGIYMDITVFKDHTSIIKF